MKVTKDVLVKELIEKGINKSDAVKAVNSVVNTLKNSLIVGDVIELRGFGSFKTVIHAAKKARDISKNVTVEIPERKYPKFKPSKELVVECNK